MGIHANLNVSRTKDIQMRKHEVKDGQQFYVRRTHVAEGFICNLKHNSGSFQV